MDALSLTRERVRVWVCATLPNTRMHWRRRRILIRGDFAGPPAPSPQPSPVNLTGEGPDARHALIRARSWRLSTVSGQGEGIGEPSLDDLFILGTAPWNRTISLEHSRDPKWH